MLKNKNVVSIITFATLILFFIICLVIGDKLNAYRDEHGVPHFKCVDGTYKLADGTCKEMDINY